MSGNDTSGVANIRSSLPVSYIILKITWHISSVILRTICS